MKKEYKVKFWGSCMNDGWIWKQMPELGESKHHWFDTAEERTAFIEKIKAVMATGEKNGPVAIFDTCEGDDTRIRSVAVCTMVTPDGKRYTITEDFGYGDLQKTADFIFFDYEENNRSCDHRRQAMIAARYPDYVRSDELDTCNETIVLENLHVTLVSEFITEEQQAELLRDGRHVIAMFPEAFGGPDGSVDFTKCRPYFFQSMPQVDVAAFYAASNKQTH